MKSQFEFKQPNVMYKLRRGTGVIISNATMTDEKAIEFLQNDPNRIKYFRKYPENWQELIGLEVAEQVEAPSEPEVKEEAVKTAVSEPKSTAKGCKSCKKTAANKAKSKTTKQ